MSIKLRELIRLVRSCKTAAEERSVIAKECAHIRASFKEEESQYRQRNIAKLLFIHMLGYSSSFGQVECLKLIASNKFSEKRVGYLALCQLLDEDSEILLLATNSIKNDLNSSNQYVNGLALTSIANIAPKEMCRAVFREVCELLMVGNPFIKKRALLSAVHIIRVVDDIEIECFLPYIPSLLEDKHHGVLLGTCHLLNTIIQYHPDQIEALGHFLPFLIRILNTISMAGYLNSTEYESGGITDQFLHVHILRVIGNLCSVIQPEIKEEVCALLAQLLTNTDHSKNGGNSILYECVRSIIKLLPFVEEEGLYMLAVNVVTRFLQNIDMNTRFIALGLLENMTNFKFDNFIDNASITTGNKYGIAPHQSLILDCLKDPDPSIKRRALKVIFTIVNNDNIKHFVKDLLNILLLSVEKGDNDFAIELATGLCIVIKACTHANPIWFIDTFIKLFCLAGNLIKEEERDSFLSYLSSLGESLKIHSYIVEKLYLSLLNHLDQLLLIQTTVWCIGEYSQFLFQDNKDKNFVHDRTSNTQKYDMIDPKVEDSKHVDDALHKGISNMSAITSESIIDLLEYILTQNIREFNSTNCLLTNLPINMDISTPLNGIGYVNSPNTIETTILLTLVALIKCSTRLPKERLRIQSILKSHLKSWSIEIQQRTFEYFEILQPCWDANRKTIFDLMPQFNFSKIQTTPRASSLTGIGVSNIHIPSLNNKLYGINKVKKDSLSEVNNGTVTNLNANMNSTPITIDLLDLDFSPDNTSYTTNNTNKEADKRNNERILVTDLLDDFVPISTQKDDSSTEVNIQVNTSNQDISGLLPSLNLSPTSQSITKRPNAYSVLDDLLDFGVPKIMNLSSTQNKDISQFKNLKSQNIEQPQTKNIGDISSANSTQPLFSVTTNKSTYLSSDININTNDDIYNNKLYLDTTNSISGDLLTDTNLSALPESASNNLLLNSDNVLPPIKTIQIFENSNIMILIDLSKQKDLNTTNILAKYFNIGTSEVSEFKLEIAVPKYLNIHLSPASNDVIPPYNSMNPVTQEIKIKRIDQTINKPILMKLRISYNIDRQSVLEYSNVTNIPTDY
ncbi:AP-1 complex subunit gamma protein [Cryptosporidium andersoni]|uniref:AP-1 complex subunit gamma protein n=1 Tax=Cryptosporidium andersoni TaxID=117008 RepID=A0A1J4MV90_9CRYT|nr:AP-1 complex subunit gamma protein [Cryptosporidium andersoni]